MRVVNKIDLFNDEDLMEKMLKYSWMLLLIGLVIAGVWAFIIQVFVHPDSPFLLDEIKQTGFLTWTVWLVAGIVGSFCMHELIHGMFFKLFGPAGAHVKFGCNMSVGALYATAPHVVYGSIQFLVIILAPLVIVSALCLGLTVFFDSSLLLLLVFVVHISGCAGDVMFAQEILKCTRDHRVCVMDTEVGITIFECEAGDKKLPCMYEETH